MPQPAFRTQLQAIEARIALLRQTEGDALADWLYLVHHVHVDPDTGEETIHHCQMVDHLGNLYVVEHVDLADGEVAHALIGLAPDQTVYWSNEEAIADGQEIPCANRQLASE